ncbi:MAG: thiol:disulfide interchange protein [Methylophilaceae bacterium]|nr:thiol:disulfide interchange protein [Methylophilaceae bacterium]
MTATARYFFRVIQIGVVTLLLGYSAGHAFAASSVADTEHVRAELIASVDKVYPGAEIELGINERIIPHWHTYWQNSGDSGEPTTIQWTLPRGVNAGEIQWPIPKRFSIGPVTNYGYEHEVTLLSAVKVPANAVIGGVFPIHAKVGWLVCNEICIPETVELNLNLPIVAKGSATGKGSPLIEKARKTLPQVSPWSASVEYQQHQLLLRISGNASLNTQANDLYFYPLQWGRILHNVVQTPSVDGNTLVLKLKPGEAPVKPSENLSGVLVVSENRGGEQVATGYVINAAISAASSPIINLTAEANESANLGLPAALLLALLGGVILNLMPCVFPVLSIKALSLLSHVHQEPLQTRLHGLAYTLGILVSFSLLAGLLIALKAGGAQIGWGFQFQSPVFVLVVAYLMFGVGLSLSGVFTIGNSVVGVGSSLAQRSGYSGSFFTGVLATIVATPCTAPFMGAALGYALAQSPVVLLSVFLSLGLGLALPYLLLSSWPYLQRWLPRPGVWMERVKQGLAFPMYLAAVWLIWVLAQQRGANAIAVALGGMVAIAFAAWLYGITRNSKTSTRHGSTAIAVIAVLIALTGGYAGVLANPANAKLSNAKLKNEIAATKSQNWEPYSSEKLQSLLAQGKPVFLNFTAAWCISCLANERVTLSDSKVIAAFKNSGITYLKGDWTNQDVQITQFLKEFGRSGVPLYVAYPANRKDGKAVKPVVLPQILTPEIVVNAVKL